MKTAKRASALFLLLATSTASWAAATAEEAARIQASFQSYLGAEPGVIAVVPAGDGYDITLDATPYLKKSPAPGLTAKLDPFKMTATPQGNGMWTVKSSGPFNATFDVPNALSFSMQAQTIEWSGTYSEAIFAFTESSYNIANLAISQRTIDPQTNITTNQATVLGSIAGKGTSTDKGNGLADSEGSATFANVVSSVTVDIPADAQAAGVPNLNYVANMAKGDYSSSIKDMNAKAIMDIVAFFVARPSKELIIKDQTLMKEKLLAALPMFQNISSDGTLENMTIDTGLGRFSIDEGGSYIAMNGAVKEGRFGEGFSLSGLKMPDSLPLPPWSKGLVPTSFKLGFDVSDFDAEAPARKFITEMDVTKPDPVPPGSEMAYLAAVAPKNAITLTIPPGEIAADLYKLSYEGVSNISLAGGLPAVSAKLRMTGMDKVIAQLQQAAADPMAQQGMAMLFAIKGIGKAEGDTTIWDVTFGADNKLMVNGTDVSAMLGALGGLPPQAPAQ